MAEAGKTRRTQAERTAESERKIIHAARELFAQQGYTRTTLNQVGELSGYTGGLVTHRFGSKENLLKAVVRQSSSRFAEDQVKPILNNDSAAQDIANYIEVYLTEISKRESHMRALYVIMGEGLGAVPEIREEIAALNQGFRKRLAGIVQQGIDAGEFHTNLDAQAAGFLILALLRGATMQILADSTAANIKDLIPLIQRQVLLSLR